MPQLRHDPLNNRWVVIAPERARRPQIYSDRLDAPEPVDPATDPFAEGNERFTTPEIYAIRQAGSAPNRPGWSLRVIPNKYPALQVEGEWAPPSADLFTEAVAIGAHEVVVESSDSRQLHELPVEAIAEVLRTFRLRTEDLYRDRRIVQVLPFKNHGQDAGATLPHSHSQIVGLPFLSPVLRTQLDALQAHWDATGRSLFADILSKERVRGERIVYNDGVTLALCPYASAFPYEVAVYPRQVAPDYRSATEEQLQSLAAAVKRTVLSWYAVLGTVPYNFILHSAPSDTAFSQVRESYPQLDSYYCWHVQLFPRLTRQAGFEWGTGCFINVVAPEDAAAMLRAVESAA